jgi:hypothetical protein
MAAPGQETPARPKRRVRVATITIGVVIAGFAVMWIYAWFFAPRGNVDRFDDPAWTAAAEKLCATTRDKVLALPAASTFADIEPRAEALRQRAVVLDQATALMQAQYDGLRANEPTDEQAREGVDLWLGDWEGYLESRRVQADRLRRGEDKPFTVPEEGGAPVTLRMDAFAKTNGMPSCVVPDDVG